MSDTTIQAEVKAVATSTAPQADLAKLHHYAKNLPTYSGLRNHIYAAIAELKESRKLRE